MSVFAPLLYDELSRSLQELDKRASRANCDVVCMFSQEEMVASWQVEWHDEYVHVNLFGVHQAYRGKGIPKRMLAWLEEECRKRGIARIEFETLEDWQSRHWFYEKRLGFTRGESFIRDGVQYRKFRKFLQSY
jgi:GNAT superfamily N-acetyltransferase